MSDEQAEEKPKNLSQKILAIQDSAGVVRKNGKFGSEMGSGNYLRIEDAVKAVSKLMHAHGLILTGTLQKKPDGMFYFDRHPHKGDKGYISAVVMEWTLEDAETGERRSWDIPGEGYDSTDKATSKAQTGSRKYAIIDIFALAVGNDAEANVAPEQAKEAQKKVAKDKVAQAAGRGVPAAVDAMSQIEPDKAVIITRPESFNGHYIAVSGLIAVPQLERFFDDTGSKRFVAKADGKPYWRVPEEYEKGLIALCEKLKIEVA